MLVDFISIVNNTLSYNRDVYEIHDIDSSVTHISTEKQRGLGESC